MPESCLTKRVPKLLSAGLGVSGELPSVVRTALWKQLAIFVGWRRSESINNNVFQDDEAPGCVSRRRSGLGLFVRHEAPRYRARNIGTRNSTWGK